MGDWRTRALIQLTSAVSRERHHGEPGLTEATLSVLRANTRSLLPTEADLELAVRTRQPVRVLQRAHWARRWQHYLAPSTSTAPAPVTDDSAVAGLRRHLETAVAEATTAGQAGHHELSALTRWLTENVASSAYGQMPDRARRWNVFRELSVPITTPGKSSRFGRIDVTVMRPDAPDLVVEIDSAHNDGSAHKLAFARDAGAAAVWVRWHSGRVEAPAGVAVIDLLASTRGLAAKP